MNQEKLFCENCGAAISKSDAKCPFCGHINYIGAENAYMNELYQTEDEMSELVNEQKNEIKDEVKKNGRFIIKILVVIGLVLIAFGLIFGGIRLFHYVEDQILLMHQRNAIEWQKENFPQFDALYEAEDYNGLLSLYDKFMNEGNYKDKRFYEWKHNGLVDCYRKYLDLSHYINGYMDPQTVSHAFYLATWFYYRQYDLDFMGMPDEDVQKVDEKYRGAASDFLHDYFKLTDEDLDEILSELVFDVDSGIISFDKCNTYIEEMNNN